QGEIFDVAIEMLPICTIWRSAVVRPAPEAVRSVSPLLQDFRPRLQRSPISMTVHRRERSDCPLKGALRTALWENVAQIDAQQMLRDCRRTSSRALAYPPFFSV